MADSTFSLLQLFRMGGVFMWPLLVFSVAVTGIVVERLIFFLRHDLRLSGLQAKTEEVLAVSGVEGAAAWLDCLPRRKMGARILHALLGRPGLSERHREKAAETESLACIAELESGLNYLTALGSLAPLTGFLGTVSGMIGAFKSIAEATEVNAQIVANGIYEALITTVFGLIIAIVAMAAHSVFTNIVDNFASGVERACSDVIMDIAAPEARGKR